MYEIKSRRLRSQILTCFIFLVSKKITQILTCFIFLVFKKITVSLKKATLQKKNVIIEEELDCIDTDDIENLENSPRLVFIDEKCGNLIVVDDGGELNRSTNQKKKTDVLQ